MKKAILILLTGLILASCGPKDGDYIVSEGHKIPAHYYTYHTFHRVGKVSIMIPHQAYVGDKYELSILDKDKETSSIYVTEDFYKTVKVGDKIGIRNDSIFHE
jgi:hypothetical protein